MHQIVFQHADRNLIFHISSVPWNEQGYGVNLDQTLGQIFGQMTQTDAGKVLIVNQLGHPEWIRLSRNTVRMRHEVIIGTYPTIVENINALAYPLVIQDNELWILTDQQSGKAYMWMGGPGTFGSRGQGITVLPEHVSLLGFDVSGASIQFASETEAAAGILRDIAMSPFSVRFSDIDGGVYP